MNATVRRFGVFVFIASSFWAANAFAHNPTQDQLNLVIEIAGTPDQLTYVKSLFDKSKLNKDCEPPSLPSGESVVSISCSSKDKPNIFRNAGEFYFDVINTLSAIGLATDVRMSFVVLASTPCGSVHCISESEACSSYYISSLRAYKCYHTGRKGESDHACHSH